MTGTDIIDYHCDAKFCTSCIIPAPDLIMRVRGLCNGSVFDRTYIYQVDSTGDPYYMGDVTTEIRYDEGTGGWVWRIMDDGDKNATTKKVQQRRLHLGEALLST